MGRSLLPGFETLQKAFLKAKSVVEKEGTTPVFYIRTLVELEDFIQSVSICKATVWMFKQCACVCAYTCHY